MANRRMFSLKIVDSDAFMDMGQGAQLLYFHLAMRADDDGFISNPKKIMRAIGSGEDDIKVLLAKRFLLPMDEGIVVIKHWWMHNTFRKDRYNLTQYKEQFDRLTIKDNGAYTERSKQLSLSDRQQTGAEPVPQIKLNKIKLNKKNTEETSSSEIPLLIKEFESLNPAVKRMYGNTTQRKACADLIKTYTFERVVNVIKNTLPKTNGLQYFPTITTPLQLMDKWVTLESAIRKYQSENKDKKEKYPII